MTMPSDPREDDIAGGTAGGMGVALIAIVAIVFLAFVFGGFQ